MSLPIEFWRLDFSHVKENRQVQAQGDLLCIKTVGKGYFSLALERYPTRQDLAIKTFVVKFKVSDDRGNLDV